MKLLRLRPPAPRPDPRLCHGIEVVDVTYTLTRPRSHGYEDNLENEFDGEVGMRVMRSGVRAREIEERQRLGREYRD